LHQLAKPIDGRNPEPVGRFDQKLSKKTYKNTTCLPFVSAIHLQSSHIRGDGFWANPWPRSLSFVVTVPGKGRHHGMVKRTPAPGDMLPKGEAVC